MGFPKLQPTDVHFGSTGNVSWLAEMGPWTRGPAGELACTLGLGFFIAYLEGQGDLVMPGSDYKNPPPPPQTSPDLNKPGGP